jgi:pimeloyl-ACP methyl ester carboxylesterase
MNKTIIYQQKKIFYRCTGNGKPVILIHGFGEDGEIWNQQAAHLSNNYKVIVPDLPGSGKSEMIDDMSMEGMAEEIHSIIHEEDIDACPVIGHSMGGYIALALAESYYNHVSALGLFHSTSFADSDEKKEARRKGIAFINQHGAFPFLKNTIPNLYATHSIDETPELPAQQIAAAHNFSAPALVSYYEAMMQRPDRTNVLKADKRPVLFVMGKYDTAVPLADGLKQCHLPEKSYIHILQNSGHMGMVQEPDAANEILEKFLLEN